MSGREAKNTYPANNTPAVARTFGMFNTGFFMGFSVCDDLEQHLDALQPIDGGLWNSPPAESQSSEGLQVFLK
jgi:hypothetical protein